MSEKPKIVDTEGLSNADWAEINKLLRAYDAGGSDAFWEAIEELGDEDPVRYVAVAGAFFPDLVRKIIRDEMAEQGMTEEDVRDLFEKLKMGGGPDTKHLGSPLYTGGYPLFRRARARRYRDMSGTCSGNNS